MSPQLLWTIAGLVLTVLTLGGVTVSSFQSVDSATSRLIASEAGNVATATKLWLAGRSPNGTFQGITAESLQPVIPDLTSSGTGAASTLASKAATGVTYAIASTTPFRSVVITVSGMTSADQAAAVNLALQGKACTSAYTNGATTLTYTCNG